jgi:hypothetical protein
MSFTIRGRRWCWDPGAFIALLWPYSSPPHGASLPDKIPQLALLVARQVGEYFGRLPSFLPQLGLDDPELQLFCLFWVGGLVRSVAPRLS